MLFYIARKTVICFCICGWAARAPTLGNPHDMNEGDKHKHCKNPALGEVVVPPLHLRRGEDGLGRTGAQSVVLRSAAGAAADAGSVKAGRATAALDMCAVIGAASSSF